MLAIAMTLSAHGIIWSAALLLSVLSSRRVLTRVLLDWSEVNCETRGSSASSSVAAVTVRCHVLGRSWWRLRIASILARWEIIRKWNLGDEGSRRTNGTVGRQADFLVRTGAFLRSRRLEVPRIHIEGLHEGFRDLSTVIEQR